jgi:hypothetical protein
MSKERPSIGRLGRRGPLPGATERFAESDRALFPEIDRMIAQGSSLRAAAYKLVAASKVPGVGSARSRAERLAARYRKERGSAK